MKKIQFDNFGGRKWITGVACLAAEITLLCCNLISATIFKELFLITLAIAVGGNIAQRIWGKEEKNIEEKSE